MLVARLPVHRLYDVCFSQAIVVPSSSGTPVKRLPRPVSKTTVSPGKVKKVSVEIAHLFAGNLRIVCK